MNQRAKYQLIGLISGLVMIAVGVFLFMSKTRIESGFLRKGGSWAPWKIILVLLPLVAGIIMLIVKPDLKASGIVALVGALVVVIVIFSDVTVIIEKDFKIAECILDILLIVVGIVLCLMSLFLKKRNSRGI